MEEGQKYARKCDKCGDGMDEGYVVGGGEKYYCSEECLHKDFTEEEWSQMYAAGEGDSYWTEWEEDYQYQYINEKLVELEEE